MSDIPPTDEKTVTSTTTSSTDAYYGTQTTTVMFLQKFVQSQRKNATQ